MPMRLAGSSSWCISEDRRPEAFDVALSAGRAVGLSAVFCGLGPAGEEAEQFADGDVLAGWPGQREVGLDLVAVAAAILALGHVAGLGEVGDDGVGAALGDAQVGGDVAQPHPPV